MDPFCVICCSKLQTTLSAEAHPSPLQPEATAMGLSFQSLLLPGTLHAAEICLSFGDWFAFSLNATKLTENVLQLSFWLEDSYSIQLQSWFGWLKPNVFTLPAEYGVKSQAVGITGRLRCFLFSLLSSLWGRKINGFQISALKISQMGCNYRLNCWIACGRDAWRSAWLVTAEQPRISPTWQCTHGWLWLLQVLLEEKTWAKGLSLLFPKCFFLTINYSKWTVPVSGLTGSYLNHFLPSSLMMNFTGDLGWRHHSVMYRNSLPLLSLPLLLSFM